MRVIVRVDASAEIGTGHLMRCLTLARMLSGSGASVSFMCRTDSGELCELIDAHGYRVTRLTPAQAAWQEDAAACGAALRALGGRPELLVVDHYGLDARWERALRPLVQRILVLDDLADRPHDCDLLLDQSLHDRPAERYAALVGRATRVFVGPRYALLRPEFDECAPRLRDNGLQRLLIFFGGSDPSNEVLKLIGGLRTLGSRVPNATLVLGLLHAAAGQVRAAARGIAGLEILAETSEMARLMAAADLGVGTCGGAAWERCSVGLPALVVVSADNQRDDARILHALGAVRNLGDASAVTVEHWSAQIMALAEDRAALLAMSRAAAGVLQGRGPAMRDLEAALFAGGGA